MTNTAMMTTDHFDHRLLLLLAKQLKEEDVLSIRDTLAHNYELLARFEDVIQEARDLSDEDILCDDALSDWSLPDDDDSVKNCFIALLEQHYLRWKQRARHTKQPWSREAFGMEFGCDHNKRNRITRDGGQGPQYHDNVRMICFVCHMSYLEAVEFLWSACQPFDRTSERDYLLADCLCKKIYEPTEVDKILVDNKQHPLFDALREKKK